MLVAPCDDVQALLDDHQQPHSALKAAERDLPGSLSAPQYAEETGLQGDPPAGECSSDVEVVLIEPGRGVTEETAPALSSPAPTHQTHPRGHD